MGNFKSYVVWMVISLALMSASSVFAMDSEQLDGRRDSDSKGEADTLQDSAEFLKRATVIPLSWGRVLSSGFDVNGNVKLLTCHKQSSLIRALGISAGIQWMLAGVVACGAPAPMVKGAVAVGVCGHLISWLYHAMRSHYEIAIRDLKTGKIEARRVLSRRAGRPVAGCFLDSCTLEIADSVNQKLGERAKAFVFSQEKGTLVEVEPVCSDALRRVRDIKQHNNTYNMQNMLLDWEAPGSSHSDGDLKMFLDHAVIYGENLSEDENGPVMRYLRSSPAQNRVVVLDRDTEGRGNLCIVNEGSEYFFCTEQELYFPKSLRVASVENAWQLCSPRCERFVFLQRRAPYDPDVLETVVVNMKSEVDWATEESNHKENVKRFCEPSGVGRKGLFKKRLAYGAAVTFTGAAFLGAVALWGKMVTKS